VICRQKATGKSLVDNIIWKIFINVCLGVWYLHSQDIIHRDLKPLNVFMAKESVAKIGDLGCADKLPTEEEKLQAEAQEAASKPKRSPQKPGSCPFDMEADIEEFDASENLFSREPGGAFGDSFLVGDEKLDLKDLSQSIQILQEKTKSRKKNNESQHDRVGTPFYLAPELWRNQPCTKASDIWALGVILYELCCHGYPFPATEESELKHKVLNQKMEKIRRGTSIEFTVFIN